LEGWRAAGVAVGVWFCVEPFSGGGGVPFYLVAWKVEVDLAGEECRWNIVGSVGNNIRLLQYILQ
jgi:hypothetical protein